MSVLFLLLLLSVVLNLEVKSKGIFEDYLSRDNTQIINGIFIIIVFLSHSRQYVQFTSFFDMQVIGILKWMSQLMVATFLFFSGYGIYESIKRKGMEYIDSIPTKRFGKTFRNFAFAVCLYVIVRYIATRKTFSISTILLSFLGYKTVGNSNWYMMAIFILYIITYVSFKICKNRDFIPIVSVTGLSLVTIYIMSQHLFPWYSNTMLCYSAGMWYSYFKEKIDSFIDGGQYRYYCVFCVSLIAFLLADRIKFARNMTFNMAAVLFCLFIAVLSMKIRTNSKELKWIGSRLFWVYIMQRMPMIIFSETSIKITDYPTAFVLLSFFITIILTIIMDNMITLLDKKLSSQSS